MKYREYMVLSVADTGLQDPVKNSYVYSRVQVIEILKALVAGIEFGSIELESLDYLAMNGDEETHVQIKG